jgi:capsular polysaccharide biosynthesis protein
VSTHVQPVGAPPQPVSSLPAPSRGRRRAVLFVACTTLLALIAATLYLGLRSDRYEANADVLVAPLATDDPEFQGLPLIRESSDGSRPVQTAAGLLRGTAIAALTAETLGGDWTEQKVEDAVGVAPRGESNLVAVTAQSDNADEAAEVANRYANAALQFRLRSIEPALEREIRAVEAEGGNGAGLQRLRDAKANGDPTLSISSPARAPSSSSLPSAPLVLLAALIVGLLVGIAGVLVADVARTPPTLPA